MKGQRMYTDNRLFHEPAERLPALLLAVIVTCLVFAAIDAGFTVPVPHLAEGVLAAQPAWSL